MSFDLPPEYVELQATVRKLAQEKVAPRAREIDTDGRRTRRTSSSCSATPGLLGLVIPEEYGGVGRRDPRPHASRSKRSRSTPTPRR